MAAPLRDLEAGFQAVAAIMEPARHPWWVISSAALVLLGHDPGPVGDIDVLFDARDAARVLAPLGLAPAPGGEDARFRSDLFVWWDSGAFPVELFANFAVRDAGQWTPLVPTTRRAITRGPARLYVPEPAELREIFLRFGREKDLRRAALL